MLGVEIHDQPIDLSRRPAFSLCATPASKRAIRNGLITIGASRPRSRCFFMTIGMSLRMGP
jgi:hypothetical protein